MDSDNEQPEQHNEDTWQFCEDVVHGYLAQEEEQERESWRKKAKEKKAAAMADSRTVFRV